MATQLSLYNHALLSMKERRLASLTEDREARRVLDEFYSQVLQFCLEQGMWKFAMRASTLTQNASGLYGFTYKFDKPTDLVHLFAASDSVDYDPPLVYDFVDEGRIFYANTSPLYIRYSSNSTSYGLDLTQWPQTFAEYVALELASWTCYSITGNSQLAVFLDRQAKAKLANSLSLYGLVAPSGQLPLNTWARSPTAAEETNFHPEILPFGAELKVAASSQQQGS